MDKGTHETLGLEYLKRNLSCEDEDAHRYFALYQQLLSQLRTIKRVAVAFSGGVDSALLLFAAHDALGENAMALTAHSVFFSEQEARDAANFCSQYGIRQQIVHVDSLGARGVAENGPDRCYKCKLALMQQLKQEAHGAGMQLVEGSNASDAHAYRPGSKALRELDVASPLADVDMMKADVRAISRALGLPQWNKPSLACLATRFPYGQRITLRGLRAVDQAEKILRDAGFTQVRVRVHDNVARVELLPSEMPKLLCNSSQAQNGLAKRIYDAFRELGFNYTAIDLLGYRTGSADEILEDANERN
ncbi:ATP-dependent sacrificial sulfur transferase LarE [Adlercreutzia sp. ZJ154]|uniref:ATP-dependent sacrificial sulfur transferase LarE n=1 Tax=Adlercreutzia sp. ZJ154 TaxID=2709790 RepID=UPI0013EC3F8E|nr:ATP-dependent sacrificial sulfur transferase LarE [Adlercreutzia sp. ZJ154]